MDLFLSLWRQRILALAYLLGTAFAVLFTRHDVGVAFVSGATAVLIAALLRTSRRHWLAPMAACGVVSVLVTGLFGVGWLLSLPLTLINLFEAAFAVWLFRALADRNEPLQSLGWYSRFVFVAGIAAPLAATALATALLVPLGHGLLVTAFTFFISHALGNLAITPIAMVMTGRKRQKETRALLRRRTGDVVAVTGGLLGVSLLVFSQSGMPLLFLPVMIIILATFRLGRVGAAIGVLVVAIVGGSLTAFGHGPIQLMHLGNSGNLVFFQFYLAATVLTVIPVSADLHHRRALYRRIKLNEQRFRMITELSSDLLMHIQVDGSFLYVSPSIRQIAGYDPDKLIGKQSREFIAPEHQETVRENHLRTMQAGGAIVAFDHLGVLADGTHRWFETFSRALFDDDGEVDGVLSIARDVHDRKARETILSVAALTDSLTGLPNRRAFEARFVERSREPGTGGRDCLAIFDLDHFKQVNDLHGHDVGDGVLRAFASLAKQSLRPNDLLARLGGEEFVALFPDTELDQAMQVCERLRRRLSQRPIAVGGIRIRVTVSGGVARIGDGGLIAALKVADDALYRAKGAGRDQLALAA